MTCRELGPLDRLAVEEVDDPVPGAGQVVVDVAAAGVNYVDALFVQGRYQMAVQPPFTPGSEVAGVVAACGEGAADEWSVGDRVVATTGLGGFASRVVVPAASLVAVPERVSLPAAACMVQSYCTALFSHTRRVDVRPGKVVLVLGAGGGVGLAAIDVARALGARVLAAASSEAKRAAALASGAEAAVDYTTEDLKARARELSGQGGVDVVVDPVGGSTADAALRSLRTDGRYLVIGFTAGIPSLPLNQVLLNNRHVVGVDWGAWAMRNPTEQRALLHDVLALVADGRLTPPEPTTRPLDDAAAVLADLVERRVTGKVALVP